MPWEDTALLSDKQTPVASPFGHGSTAREVIAGHDFSGKTVIITGASAGLGVETARAFAEAGARVILPVRSPDKARAATADMTGTVELADLDLGDPGSIRRFADSLVSAGRPIDRLINNAGIMATPERRTPEGYESQFATNHLGHFLLTALLLPVLLKADAPRVVALSSIGHRRSPVRFEDLHFRKEPYEKWTAYGQSKTANALFALGLDRRFAHRGLHAYSVHPGGIMTDLQRDLQREEMIAMGWMDEAGTIREGFKTPEQGASTTVWAATSPLLDDRGGVYCEDCNIAAYVKDRRAFVGVHPYATDPDLADRLWYVSERLLDVSVPL